MYALLPTILQPETVFQRSIELVSAAMFGNIDFCDLFNYLSIYLTVHLFMANLVT